MVVAYQNQIVMAETLDLALEQLFGSGREPLPDALPAGAVLADLELPSPAGGAVPAPSAAAGSEQLVAQASEHYSRALRAQRDGDWALYGQEIERLGEVLERLGSGPS